MAVFRVLPAMLSLSGFQEEKVEGHTLVTAGQSECCDSPNYSENIVRKSGDDFALRWIWSVEGKTRTRSRDNLLLFGPSKLSQDSLGDSSRRLNCQRVHEHGRGSRHDLGGRPSSLLTENKIKRVKRLETALPALHALFSNVWRLEAGGAA